MSLGQRLLQARQEAGLSQRQLCGDTITRNMLSQIEHDTAKPSMSTLRILAERLGKPLSFFLEESAVVSANTSCMDGAWQAFESGAYADALELLEAYHAPDPIYDREFRILSALARLSLAEQAAAEGRIIYARSFLGRIRQAEAELPWLPSLRHRRVLLQGKLKEPLPAEELPNVDAELLLLAQTALESEAWNRAGVLLDAAEDQEDPRWNLLRGKAAMGEGAYGTAAKYLQQAEECCPDQVIPAMEVCFRELGDYKTAYYYACKGRG